MNERFNQTTAGEAAGWKCKGTIDACFFPDCDCQRNADDPDRFVVHRLRAKPVEYSVRIRHFVSGGEWHMGVEVRDVASPDPVQRERIAADLRKAAELVETAEWEVVSNAR